MLCPSSSHVRIMVVPPLNTTSPSTYCQIPPSNFTSATIVISVALVCDSYDDFTCSQAFFNPTLNVAVPYTDVSTVAQVQCNSPLFSTPHFPQPDQPFLPNPQLGFSNNSSEQSAQELFEFVHHKAIRCAKAKPCTETVNGDTGFLHLATEVRSSCWAVGQVQDARMGIVVGAVFQYLDPFPQSFPWVCLPLVEEAVDDLEGSSLSMRRHALQRKSACCSRRVRDNSQSVDGAEGENH